MKQKKVGLIWIGVGLVPYIGTLIYSIYAIYNGISNCLIDFGEQGCDIYYGVAGFAETWYIALYVLYPIYLVFLLFFILGLSKTRFTGISYGRLLLVFGMSPFLLAIFLLIFACLATPETSISILFANIFMKQFFVLFSEIIGIIMVLSGLRKIRIEEHKKKNT